MKLLNNRIESLVISSFPGKPPKLKQFARRFQKYTLPMFDTMKESASILQQQILMVCGNTNHFQNYSTNYTVLHYQHQRV